MSEEQITLQVTFEQGNRTIKFPATLSKDTLLFTCAGEIVQEHLSDDIVHAPSARLRIERPGNLEPLVFELVPRWELVGR